ncbi:hypothetical protein T10_8020 [Trichinella papuae]|uniref:Uncharacterized protein n=1 Tax=Trichinella papuae TaxID=268474 RepID=A0A0V1LZS0_9BILA|nr:hypothetical protein T10_8020 [Trichinella papuae]
MLSLFREEGLGGITGQINTNSSNRGTFLRRSRTRQFLRKTLFILSVSHYGRIKEL